LALAICFAIIAIYSFVEPPLSRPTGGRWSGFFAAIWDILAQTEFKVAGSCLRQFSLAVTLGIKNE
jgi:hypothetical protein